MPVSTSPFIRELPLAGERAPASPEAARQAAARLLDFAWDLYPRLTKPTENFAYSPYSVSAAMAIVSAGASGVTLSEIQKALHFPKDLTTLHAQENALALALATRSHRSPAPKSLPGPGASAKSTVPSLGQRDEVLEIANDLWLRPDVEPEAAVLAAVTRHYGPRAHLVDFGLHPAEVREAINARIEEATEGLLPGVVPKAFVDATTVLIITNALYFSGGWRKVFRAGQTRWLPFYRVDGGEQSVLTMERRAPLAHTTTPDYTLVALPYVHEELEMVVVMPRPDTFTRFVRALTAGRLRALVEAPRQTAECVLRLPSFSVDAQPTLTESLEMAGMRRAFHAGAAELQGWSGPAVTGVFISSIIQAAKVIVDEKGTRAAAVTIVREVEISERPLPPPLPIIAIDHPFLFLIRDRPTGAVLFMGQVVSFPEGTGKPSWLR